MSALNAPRLGSALDRLGPRPTIGVLRPGCLGDLIVITPALQALRDTVPGATIGRLVKDQQRPLASRLSMIDVVVRLPPHPAYELNSPHTDATEMEGFFTRMRACRFNVMLQGTGAGVTTNPFVKALGTRITGGPRSPDAPERDL